MPQSPTIQEELQELNSSLAPSPQPSVYTVPEGYFASLAAEILTRVKAGEADTPAAELEQLSPLLAGISKRQVYSVPEEYFSELDPSFAWSAAEDAKKETAQLSPLLAGLSRRSPFSLPEGYLEQPLSIPFEEKQSAPVVTLKPRKWRGLAIAASVAAVIALGISLWVKQNRSTPGTDTQSYAWVEKNMKKVSTDDISKFVDLAAPAAQDLAAGGPSDDIKGLLKNVSDKEIQDFLKDVPVDETDDDILFN
ncbi:hypothetical protein LZZ85_09425 [Terrimonas sp. NA20]|uniref:Uncharacterized protein n=1 Tax=Terrimonas ginsenosidimutans TaxID=2908004 RepID=A0ABS9KQB4_9BACT|nr:hypothetical protein [Terrimonas ginsenosidimutans]MCG2614501.1 hypothetical protein [Terrimonas ginsenosidimutans]